MEKKVNPDPKKEPADIASAVLKMLDRGKGELPCWIEKPMSF